MRRVSCLGVSSLPLDTDPDKLVHSREDIKRFVAELNLVDAPSNLPR